MKSFFRSHLGLLIAVFLGIGTSLSHQGYLYQGAEAISALFMNFLKLLAAPLVFLSIITTLLHMHSWEETRSIGKKVVFYTILTTVLATLVALVLFLVANPVHSICVQEVPVEEKTQQPSYLSFFVNIVPHNFFGAFLENNVISIAFIAFVFGVVSFGLPEDQRSTLKRLFSSIFQLLLKTTEHIIAWMPLAIWAFTTILVQELQQNSAQLQGLSLYLGVVLASNLIQGLVVLPLILMFKGLSPIRTAKGALKALITAFFSKSSNATLPVAMKCVVERLGVQPKVAHFTLPLCTVINMNGCAAFIFITVMFVAGIHGYEFGSVDLGLWVMLATLAAIGNAGVPMGCFFLSSALLIAINVPIQTMGLILPFYALLDMVETALNVWSDVCVATIVDKEMKKLSLDEGVLS